MYAIILSLNKSRLPHQGSPHRLEIERKLILKIYFRLFTDMKLWAAWLQKIAHKITFATGFHNSNQPVREREETIRSSVQQMNTAHTFTYRSSVFKVAGFVFDIFSRRFGVLKWTLSLFLWNLEPVIKLNMNSLLTFGAASASRLSVRCFSTTGSRFANQK